MKKEKCKIGKLIRSEYTDQFDYVLGAYTDEEHYYECPCGEGQIINYRDRCPGNKSNDWVIDCPKCKEKYEI